MDIIKKEFGKQLKQIRKIKNITQETLAENIGINLRQLARIEAGESFITAETLYNICKTLKINPSVLFDFNLQNDLNINETVQLKAINNKILKIASNKEKLEFVNLALDSLTSKKALDKLKYLLKGIELSFER